MGPYIKTCTCIQKYCTWRYACRQTHASANLQMGRCPQLAKFCMNCSWTALFHSWRSLRVWPCIRTWAYHLPVPEGGIDMSPFDQPSRSNSKSSAGGRLSWTVQNRHFRMGRRMTIRLESRLPDFRTDSILIMHYDVLWFWSKRLACHDSPWDEHRWTVLSEINGGLESKAVLTFVRIAFVLVFLGERENSDMTVSGNPPKYASC